ncbi:DUF2809 domain-containing protein [Hymenobacter sp. BT662]|uniref:DUF2809 domain-containing protein n=2 Tax=Hymenobacter ruricola TaxID=2791023 RepID=A0ABS0I0Z9_9BACT|nr:DUF2809 domain-containing protein [Hymenobacter ruricola]
MPQKTVEVHSPTAPGRLLRLDYRYLGVALLLLLVEVFIALFVHDDWVRPHGGDVLAAALLYCLVRGIWALPTGVVAGIALLVSYLIEALQYVHLLQRLGWEHWRAARVLLGSRFEWADMLAYTIGVALVLLVEQLRRAGKVADQRVQENG